MSKVTIIKEIDPITEQVTEHAIIDRGNGEFTSMLKSTYDAIQAELETPKVVDEAAPE
jgi:hypothetical protein